ncbi:DNA-directed RNA polymerase I subunit RPA1-like [Ptychodera flava]|uniref:DNA-directed RNA polymerase I subunit RPA1-like n=1 Tax=Ptychodera flava TaxID=63121 RepID=UPI00396A5895
MIKSIPSKRLCGIRFTNLSTEEIKRLSVKEITNQATFDNLQHPSCGGLYDSALGPADRDDVCSTCSLNFLHCPGHFGHISLPLPVYNPLFFRLLVQILKGACLNCHHLLADRVSLLLIKAQLQCLEYGLLSVVDDLENIVREFSISHDGATTSTVSAIDTALQKYVDQAIQGINKKEASKNAKVRNVTECKQHLITNFRTNQLQHRAKCGLCKKRVQQLRTEHNSKIYFKKGSRRSTIRKASVAKKTQQQEGNAQEEESANNQANKEPTDLLSDVSEQVYLTPQNAREHMKLIVENEGSILRHLFGALAEDENSENPNSLDVFFLEVIPVPPSRFRPISKVGDKRFENPQTANLNHVLTNSITLALILDIVKQDEETQTTVEDDTAVPVERDESVLARVLGKSKVEKLHNAWINLQTRVNCLIDSSLDKLNTDKHPGIRQLLEKKEGLFRKHMMGKRVNYAARSVISPDPNIATDEIGIPEVIATKLTYPQPVTPWNVKELRQAVINGPNVHPGALIVENEDGSKTLLRAGNTTQREAIAKQLLTPNTTLGVASSKKVHRHVKNGDILLLNRQPTLHKPSIMAHRAHILPGEKTLRLHYANCKSYNADFDGDEMNVHFPQNEVGRAEAYDIMTTNNQYLVPKDSTPLSGLIQDHMVSGVRITIRGRFFNRQDYQHLVYSALTDKHGPVKLLPPTIRKPCILWSGKQVFSTLLLNIIPDDKEPLNYTGKAKISGKHWETHKARPFAAGGTALIDDDMSESEIIVRHGQLLCGVLDKAHYGPTPYGLVHCCYELYGGKVSGRLLTCLGRLFTSFLQTISGFTLGVEDILVTAKADRKRRKLLNKAEGYGPAVAAKALGVEDATDSAVLLEKLEDAHRNLSGNDMREIDLCMKSTTDEVTNDVNKVCIPRGLQKTFPDNNLQLMVQAGAKGSQVNCMQISCLLGQIELEGRRPPLMISGRSLPSFLPYDTSPRAGGFVDGRFLTGIRPQEYFFHCMAGREGLVDTAVKTSRSGYLQRCLIKHIEGLVVGYDLTVRDSDGSIIQFQYGEDALDILKTPFLREKQFPFMIANHTALLDEKHLGQISQKLSTNDVKEIQHKIKKWEKRHGNWEGQKMVKPFAYFAYKKSDKVKAEIADTETNEMELKKKTKEKLSELWRTTSDKQKYSKHCGRCPDPVLSQLQPDLHFGNTSEKFTKMVESYISANPHRLLCTQKDVSNTRLTADQFRTMMNMKYLTSLCHPGEAVGLLAAQSIGEPSTQMTLNTFHFAGRGEMNVTLGIPRLREILMVGSQNIKTPSMSIPVLPSHKAHKRAKKLKKKLTRVYLSEVLEKVNVTEMYEVKGSGMKYRIYTIKLTFLPQDCYKEDSDLTPEDVVNYVERKFLKRLVSAIKQKIKQIINTRIVDSKTRSSVLNDDLEDAVDERPNRGNKGEDEDSEDEGDESDAVARKRRQQRMDDMEYEEGGDEEEEDVEEEMEQSDEEEGQKTQSNDEEEGEKEEGGEEDKDKTSAPSVEVKKSKKKKKTEIVHDDDDKRISAVYSISDLIFDYKYDTEDDLWCSVSLRLDIVDSKMDICSVVENEAKKSIVLQTPGITRCFLQDSTVPDDASHKILQIEGVNIMEMFWYDKILNLRRLYSNDIHAMANTYGIEAARRVLIKEIQEVFKAYGIHVDSRHLTLIGDYMTFDGVYRPFNRFSLRSNSSPLQKMSFEQSMTYLKEATVDGSCDQLKSPSARLVVGRVVTGGTGSFDLIQPLR